MQTDLKPAIERVSDADRMLIVRMEARQAAHQQAITALQELVMEHLGAVYGMREGDAVLDDGTIARAAKPEGALE